MSYYRTIIAIVLVVIVISFGLTLATKWMFPDKKELCHLDEDIAGHYLYKL